MTLRGVGKGRAPLRLSVSGPSTLRSQGASLGCAQGATHSLCPGLEQGSSVLPELQSYAQNLSQRGGQPMHGCPGGQPLTTPGSREGPV